MPPKELPPDMVNFFKRGKKAQDRKLIKTLLFFGILVLAVMICFAYFLMPTLTYFLPAGDLSTKDLSTGEPVSNLESAAPSGFSLNAILGSIGFSDVVQDLEIVSSELHSSSSSWMTGKIKNNGAQPYQGFTIYYDLYDSEGNYVGSTYALMSDINPGEEKNFRTLPVNQHAASAKLKYIMGGNLENVSIPK